MSRKLPELSTKHTHHFLERKFFFHVKSENMKFLHVNNMWDFSLFIEKGIGDKK